MKKEMGKRIAIAISVVNPGKAPTNMPRNNPPAIHTNVMNTVSGLNRMAKPPRNDSNIIAMSAQIIE
jgi:hypothetical protein